MPNIKVPVDKTEQNPPEPFYIQKEIRRRVASSAHLPDDSNKKYKTTTAADRKRAAKRVRENGQMTISQLLPPIPENQQDPTPTPTSKPRKPGPTEKPSPFPPENTTDSSSSSDDPEFMPRPPKKRHNVTQRRKNCDTQTQMTQSQTQTQYPSSLSRSTSGKTQPTDNTRGKLNSITIQPPFDPNSPQPGDLVMATAADIHHPAVNYEVVNPSYLLFGVVKNYTYIKWASKEGKENWCNYTNNHKRLTVEWEPLISQKTNQRWVDTTMETPPPLNNQGPYRDLPVEIPPSHRMKLKVVCKKNSCRIDGLNPFVQEWIAAHFSFNIHYGWKHKTGKKLK